MPLKDKIPGLNLMIQKFLFFLIQVYKMNAMEEILPVTNGEEWDQVQMHMF